MAAKQAATLKAVCMSFKASEQATTDVLALSAAAVRLVLELQLLAAGAVQQQQQQQQQHASSRQQSAGSCGVLLRHSNALLHAQIRAIVQSGSNDVLAELLEQHGLQLLQALAAPVQQMQLWMSLGDDADICGGFALEGVGALPQQLCALRAAAAGLHVPNNDDNTGECFVKNVWYATSTMEFCKHVFCSVSSRSGTLVLQAAACHWWLSGLCLAMLSLHMDFASFLWTVVCTHGSTRLCSAQNNCLTGG
jgi:hypothetical protein